MTIRIATILLATALWLDASQAQTSSFTIRSIGPDVWAAIATPTGMIGGNAAVIAGSDGVIVVDAFTTQEIARSFLNQIQTLTKLPVKYVVNTHYHLDHMGGNRVFADAGAVVVAHQNVRRWAIDQNLSMLKDAPPEFRAIVNGIALPTAVFREGVDIYLGTRRVEIRTFPGHTGGDAVVFVPDAKVAICGDLLWRDTAPNLIDATTSSWIETLNILVMQRQEWTFVPGHGDIAAARDVTAFRDYLQTLRSLVGEAQRQGKSGDSLVEAVMPAFKQQFGALSYFEYLAKPNILDVDAELRGVKRIPQ